MKTIFDQATRDELINRIGSLTDASAAQWGKMNVGQMIRHCILFEEMILGKTVYKRSFVGFLFGQAALKSLLKDDRPLTRNTPTFIFPDKVNMGKVPDECSKWIALVNEYSEFSNLNFVHPFFGKMNKEQVGYMVYKHTDHHLRQFNA